jgi:hypothetical protein
MFDIRRIKVHSLKDFIREYLMIVLGILTALGLESLVTSQHHRREAEEGRQRIVAELRANLAEARSVRDQNIQRLKPVIALTAELRGQIQSGMSRQEINRRLYAAVRNRLTLGYALPTLRHEAWDVVVANQSASYIDAESLRRYSAVYAAQRDAGSIALNSATLLNGPRMLDALVDIDLQRVDPVEFLKVLGQMTATITAAQSNVQEVQTELEAALAAEGDAGALPAAVAPASPAPATTH